MQKSAQQRGLTRIVSEIQTSHHTCKAKEAPEPSSPRSLRDLVQDRKTTAQGTMHFENKQAANLRAAGKSRSQLRFPSPASPPARRLQELSGGQDIIPQASQKGREDGLFLGDFTTPD